MWILSSLSDPCKWLKARNGWEKNTIINDDYICNFHLLNAFIPLLLLPSAARGETEGMI